MCWVWFEILLLFFSLKRYSKLVFHRIHVRRTDKIGSEASEHALIEYLRKADEYFLLQEKMLDKRKTQPKLIYLATDESEIFRETEKW